MGILDDAIREHLELKRQHGAPEPELRRQEEEALGPVRRDAAPRQSEEGDGAGELEPVEATDAGPVDAFHEADPAEAVDTAEPLGDEPPADEAEPHAPPAEEASADELAASEPVVREPEPHSDETALYEPPPAADEPAPGSAPEDAETELFERGADAEDAPPRDFEALDEDEIAEGEGPPAERDDVLEETPEFLEDTPEHDRLWFEQKPPRDFDFD